MFGIFNQGKLSEAEENLLEKLLVFTDPVANQGIKKTQVTSLCIKNHAATLELMLDYAIGKEDCAAFESSLETYICAEADVEQSSVTIGFDVQPKGVKTGLKRYDEVKNIIAVASGKGGVGKSTVALNLAAALQQSGAKVGVLDIDIYGPSIPAMLGINGMKPTSPDKKHFLPVEIHGLQVMSMGFLIQGDDTPVAWRGAMLHSAVQQLAGDTLWNDLDYLIVDMPPGTGDVVLTLGAKIPVTGAVVTTTPQEIALLDAKKGLKMFEKVGIDVLGVIENMGHFICPNCEHETHVFGAHGGQSMAQMYDVPLLGQLPLDITIRQHGDNGLPVVLAEAESFLAQKYRSIATQMVAKLSRKKKDFSQIMPSVVVESDEG